MTQAQERLARIREARKTAIEHYNACVHYNIDNEEQYFQVETFNLCCFSPLIYKWVNVDDAIRYCNEQVRTGVQARVTRNQFSKKNNTLTSQVVYTR